MTFFKLRHIPTGLFFKPSKYGSRSNLSDKGKTYNAKPSLGYLGKTYHYPVDVGYPSYISREVIPSEWEVVEYQVTEVRTFPPK